jgi:hypothetical protein
MSCKFFPLLTININKNGLRVVKVEKKKKEFARKKIVRVKKSSFKKLGRISRTSIYT